MLGTNSFPDELQAFYFSAASTNHSFQCQGQNLSLNIANCQILLQGAPLEQQKCLMTCIFTLSELRIDTIYCSKNHTFLTFQNVIFWCA